MGFTRVTKASIRLQGSIVTDKAGPCNFFVIFSSKCSRKPSRGFSYMHAGFKEHFKDSLLRLQTSEAQEQKQEQYFEAIFKIMGTQIKV